jgi:hypothetical protein
MEREQLILEAQSLNDVGFEYWKARVLAEFLKISLSKTTARSF